MAKNKKSGKKKEERLSQMDLWEWTTYIVLLSVVFGTATFFYCRSYLLAKAVEGNVPVGLALQFLFILIIVLGSTIFLGVAWKESRSNKEDRELLGHLEFIFRFIEKLQDHMHQLGDTQQYENPHTIEWCSSVLKGSVAFGKRLRIEGERVDAQKAQLEARNLELQQENEQLKQNRFRRSFLNLFRDLNNEPKIENSDEPLTVTELEEFLGNFIELTRRKTLEFLSKISKLEAQIAEQRTRHEKALSDQVQVAEKKLESLKTEHASVLEEVRSQVQILKTERDIIQNAKDSSEQAHTEVVDGLNAQLFELNGRLEHASAECLRLQQELADSSTAHQSELQRSDEIAQGQISTLNIECAGRVAALRGQISELEASLASAQAAERNTTASAGLEIDRLRTEITDLRSQLDRLREEHTVVLSQKDHSHEQAVAELNQAHAQQVELLEQRIVALQAELEEARDEVIRVDDLNSVVSAEVKQLQQQVEAMTADHLSLQSKLSAAINQRPKPVMPLRSTSSATDCERCRSHAQQISSLRQQVTDSREKAKELSATVDQMIAAFKPADSLDGANLVWANSTHLFQTLKVELGKIGG